MSRHAEYMARLRREQKEKGLCRDCNAPRVSGGRCKKHRELHVQGEARRRRERTEAGICNRCGKRARLPGSTCCVTCLLNIRQRQKERRRNDPAYRQRQMEYNRSFYYKCKEEGRCPYCGFPSEGETILCTGCSINHLIPKPSYTHKRLKTDLRGYLLDENNQQSSS